MPADTEKWTWKKVRIVVEEEEMEYVERGEAALGSANETQTAPV